MDLLSITVWGSIVPRQGPKSFPHRRLSAVTTGVCQPRISCRPLYCPTASSSSVVWRMVRAPPFASITAPT